MMEDIQSMHFTWTGLLMLAVLLLGINLIIQFFKQVSTQLSASSSLRVFIKKGLHKLATAYEPFAFILLISVFVLIHPLFHGIIVILIFIAAFFHLKNYLSGRLVLLDNAIQAGEELRIGKTEGVITKSGRLGIHIRTNEGLHFISYSKLLANGYVMITGKEVGEYCRMTIAPVEVAGNTDHVTALTDYLATAPYIDWKQKPELYLAPGEATQLEAYLLLRETAHVEELIALMEEWGYKGKIIEI